MPDITSLNDIYKLDSLGILPDYCIQEIFSREVNNGTAAKIILLLSQNTRDKILSNFNQIRAERIADLVNDYENGKLKISYSSLEKNCEKLLDRVQTLKDNGLIRVPEIGLDESFFNTSIELEQFSDNLPRFNFNHNDLHDLISWWDLAAKGIRSIYGKRAQVENIILQRLEDDFSSKIFAYSVDDLGKKEFNERVQSLQENLLNNFRTRLNLIESFLYALGRNENNKYFAANLACHFDNQEEITDKLARLAPLLLYPAIKDGLSPEDIAMSLYKLKLICDEDGLEEMNKHIHIADEHFFKKGLSIIISRMDWFYAEKIIRERHKAHLDEIEIKLKMITDAVTCIRENVSPFIMLELMSSYTVYDFEE